jgi:hypothetical protein
MADDETIFDGGDDDGDNSSGRQPILDNSSEGVAAWLNRDKNGNAYLSIDLPIGLGSVALFPSNDKVRDALNQLADYLDEEDDS